MMCPTSSCRQHQCLSHLVVTIALALTSTLLPVSCYNVNTAACPGLFNLPVDQSATTPSNYGKCTEAIEQSQLETYACQRPGMNAWPGPPPLSAQKCFKFGRLTTNTGPISAGDMKATTACNARVIGTNRYAFMAVSTKYINNQQSAFEGDPGACGQCMCVRLAGADTGAVVDSVAMKRQQQATLPYVGLAFVGMVGDRCYDCDDDHIRVLLDRPFSFAAYDPALLQEDGTVQNSGGSVVNSLVGLRGFANPNNMRSSLTSPQVLGTFVADWQWVPCSTTHLQCAVLFNALGYEGSAMLPPLTRGYNVDTLAPNNATAQDPESIITALGGYATLSAEDVTQVLNLPLPTAYTLQCSNSTTTSSSNSTGGSSTSSTSTGGSSNSTTSSSNSTATNGTTAANTTTTTNITRSSGTTTTTTTTPTASTCTLTAPSSPLLRPAPSFIGVGVEQSPVTSSTSGDNNIIYGTLDSILKPTQVTRESSLLTRGTSGAAAAQDDSGPTLLIPAGAIAGLAVGVLTIIAVAWMVTAHIATRSRLNNTGLESPSYPEHEGDLPDGTAEGFIGNTPAGAMTSDLKAKGTGLESPRAAAPAELIGTSADGTALHSEDAKAADTIAAAAGFFFPVSHSAHSVASLSGGGVQRSAARPGRPMPMVQEERVRRSVEFGRSSFSGSKAGEAKPAHTKDM